MEKTAAEPAVIKRHSKGAGISGRTGRMAVYCLLTVLIAVLLLLFSGESAGGAVQGLHDGAKLLLPSLLPFMVFSSFVIRAGWSEGLGKLLSPVTVHLFRLPGSCGAAILLSFIGGFPVGAKCVRLLYDRGEITSSQAERMMLFCVCSGPAFLITGVGSLLLNSPYAGAVLYGAQVLSGMLIGTAAGRLMRHTPVQNKDGTVPEPEPRREKAWQSRPQLTGCFVEACEDGARAMISLCVMVAVFSAGTAVIQSLRIDVLLSEGLKHCGMEPGLAGGMFRIVTEVTGACRTLTETGSPLWMLSLAAGFGGLCVHFQIFAVLGDLPVRKGRYFVCRIGNALLSAVIVYLVSGREPSAAVTAFAPAEGMSAALTSTTGFGMTALLLMCVVFVLSLHGGNGRSRGIRRRGPEKQDRGQEESGIVGRLEGSYVRDCRMV